MSGLWWLEQRRDLELPSLTFLNRMIYLGQNGGYWHLSSAKCNNSRRAANRISCLFFIEPSKAMGYVL